MTMVKKSNFATDLIKFYKEFVTGNSTAIVSLAEIQENHPNEYNVMLELRDDPSVIEESDTLNEQEKTAILVIILKASKLAGKSQDLFNSSPEEKRALAKDLENFAKFVEQKLTELTKKE